MIDPATAYIIAGVGEFNLLLPQGELAAVREATDGAGQKVIRYAATEYPLLPLPDELTCDAGKRRYVVLLHGEAGGFALYAERFAFLPQDQPLACFAVPPECYAAESPFISALALHQGMLLCLTRAAALEKLREP